MKHLSRIFAVLFLAVSTFTFTSCDEETVAEILGTMTAKIGNDSWVSKTRYVNFDAADKKIIVAGTASSALELTSTMNADNTVVVTINGVDVKTYEQVVSTDISQIKTECTVIYKKEKTAIEGSSDYYISTAAKVVLKTVDENGGKVSGTFTATLTNGKDAIEITSGEFTNARFF